ncbi:MAG: hypothetical protein JO099_22290, partial [Acidobacteriia bacterium]|nr:hypothetical protein [Terriglobia bacterium]
MSEHAEGSRFMRQLRLSHYQMVWFLAVSLLPMVHAAQVVATLKGTLSSGTDFTGVFGFAPNTDLTGQAFTLTFTFDDTKGTQQVTNCTPGAPQSTEILGDSAAEGASPGTAVLQIGGHSWTFGTPPNGNLNSFASRSVPCGTGVTTDRLQFSVSDVPPSQYIGDNVSVILTTPIGSPPFTTDASWEAPLSTSLLPINSFSDGNSFDIDQDGYIGPFLTPINFARGVFVPTSITITGPPSLTTCASVIDNALSGPTLGGMTLAGKYINIAALFTPNGGLTLAAAAALCGFTAFDWEQRIISTPDPSPFCEVNYDV